MAAPRYASLSELQDLIDVQFLKMLSSDDGSDGALDLTTNTKLASALERASSDIEASALRGERYTSADLTSFQSAGDATLRGLVCDLTMYHLAARRGGDLPPAVQSRRDYAARLLKALADGELIFGKSTAAAAAGVIEAVVISPGMRSQFALASDSAFFPVSQERVI